MATDTSTDLEALKSPILLGSKWARNRIWMAPMSACYADTDGYVTNAEIEHYGRRARGGASVIVTENAAISTSGRQLPRQTMVSDERYLPGLTKLASAIHDGGALAILQIVHAGRYAGPWDEYEARRRLAPTALEFPLLPGRRVTPQEITPDEIFTVIEDFGRAAALARHAGFDGVEIHGAQGFLITQFLSPRTNHRADEWGGSFDNRARFALEVVASVRRSVPDDFIVGFHLLAQELLPGGITLDEALQLAVRLQAAKVDFLIPVTATFEDLHSHRDLLSRPRFQVAHAAAIAAKVEIPVVANGYLNGPAEAARIVASGRAAAVGLARPLLVDPDWPKKVVDGQTEDIHECPCDPPQCIRSQLGGVTCHHWPQTALSRGYFGYDD